MDKKFLFLAALFAVVISIGATLNKNANNDQRAPFVNEPVSSPDRERYYFERWHEPYGSELPPDVMQQIWSEIYALPTENQLTEAVNSWSLKGPLGMVVLNGGGARYSGRVLDIEVDNGVSTRIAAASGGLWGALLFFPVPLSDNVNTLAIGTFDSRPGNANEILIGTGEPYQRTGTGLWRTTDGGTTWTNIPMTPSPGNFYKVRFNPVLTNVVYSATTEGVYKSSNAGLNWIRHFTGNVSDLVIHPNSTNILYAGVWGDGLYRSTNDGINWTKVTTGGIPTTNVGRTSISIHKANPNIVYVSMARNDNNATLGVYKTTNGGTNWTTVTPDPNFLGGQGWYDNVVSVSPTDPNKVFAGGISMWRSTNGGSSWVELNNPNIHADQHCMTWSNDGNSAWIGNDGGVSFSNDGGMNFETAGNFWPITQYVNIDIGTSNTNYMFGGSQDNGISGTTNGGTTWTHYLGGDGGGISIDPQTASKIYITNGVYGGNWAFRRLKSTNSGINWSFIDNGVDNSGQWYHKMRNDKVSPIYLFNNSGQFVYQSQNDGNTWTKLNPTAFPCADISNIRVSRYSSPHAIVYACLNNSPPNANKLRVYDSGAWTERSTGFPANFNVRNVGQHPTNNNIAYAIMNGFAPQKIFRSTNRGFNWTNITGDLPNVPCADIVPHPTDNNKLYLGTEFGCYRTTNGGTNWHRWNNGMPEATIVTEMVYIDSLASRGTFYVVTGTYGRSTYIREISGDDPVNITNELINLPDKYELQQNFPNPFNPSTTIRFSLPADDFVKLEVFDISGRLIRTLQNGKMQPGIHNIKFEAAGLTSGVYFYRLQTSKLTDTKKMLLVK